ncbi:MAG: nitroreductase family protein [Chloroflexi bacterium]|nr:nitroreductase family protein [Chloroflexota bacterium]
MDSDYDKLLEIARRRRSIRVFKPDPIPDGHVEKILEVARWAMSGANGQPWEFVVVKDKDTRAKIYELYKAHRRFVDVIERTRIEEIRQPITGAVDEGVPLFKDAPVIIVICGDPRTLQATVMAAQFVGGERETFHMNIANATMMIHLAAASLGLGTQWATTTVHFEAGLKQLLGIPQIYKVPQVVPVGYPDYTPHGAWRRKLSDIVHNEKFDMSRYRSDEQIVADIIALRKRMKAHYRPTSETPRQ